jgi:hypothetical protein
MTPEVAPPTGPEGDNETQSRVNTSPTGYCVPLRTPRVFLVTQDFLEIHAYPEVIGLRPR